MKKIFSLCLITVISFLLLPGCITTHEQRLKELEARVAKLEKYVEPLVAAQTKKDNIAHFKEAAKQRMLADLKAYSPQQLRIAEKLYQSQGLKWKSPEKTEKLKEVLKRYPKSNRAGCAALYLGQTSKGLEQIKYLKLAVEKYSDCFYGDGVQVGPYAQYCLILIYTKSGKKEEAKRLAQELKERYPNAIDHRQRVLSKLLK